MASSMDCSIMKRVRDGVGEIVEASKSFAVYKLYKIGWRLNPNAFNLVVLAPN